MTPVETVTLAPAHTEKLADLPVVIVDNEQSPPEETRLPYSDDLYELAVIANIIRDRNLAEKIVEKAVGYLGTKTTPEQQAAAKAILPPIKRR